MASHSECPKCDSSHFEVAQETIKGTNFYLSFIRCASCGTVVGVMDFYNIGAIIHDLAKALGVKLK